MSQELCLFDVWDMDNLGTDVPKYFYDGTTDEPSEERRSGDNLNIQDVIKAIAESDYQFLERLEPHKRKQFNPYLTLKWLSGIDTSTYISFNSKMLESYIGAWKTQGKKCLTEIIECYNNDTGTNNILKASKYQAGDYDWRIKITATSMADAMQFLDVMNSLLEAKLTPLPNPTEEDPTIYLMALNTLVNKNFWDMRNDPDLVFRMMCYCSEFTGYRNPSRVWQRTQTSQKLTKMRKFVSDVFNITAMPDREIELFFSTNTSDEVTCYMEMLGLPDNEIKSNLKLFEACK